GDARIRRDGPRPGERTRQCQRGSRSRSRFEGLGQQERRVAEAHLPEADVNWQHVVEESSAAPNHSLVVVERPEGKADAWREVVRIGLENVEVRVEIYRI